LDINLDFEEREIISEIAKDELTNKITKIKNSLEKKMPKYIKFLDDEAESENYVEIYCPFFDYDITVMLSKLKEKYLISVLNHNNSKVFGNLLIEGYPCIKTEELKNFGDWKNYNQDKKLRIFKPL